MKHKLLLAVTLAAPLLQSARSPADSLRCVADKHVQVRVAGGPTLIGDDNGYAEERPASRTTVATFRIDRTEVTNAAFARFVAATGHVTSAEKRGDSITFAPPSASDAGGAWWRIVKGADWRHPTGPGSTIVGHDYDPVVHVSYADALAFAHWRGGRLPSEAEFERAAQGNTGPSKGQPAPDSANTWQGPFLFENFKFDGHAGLAPAGCYKANGYGAHDLIGNVWEWTASPYRSGHGPAISPIEPGQSAGIDQAQLGVPVRVIKGGSFLCASNYCARYRPAARHAQAEDESASHIGFRLASSPNN